MNKIYLISILAIALGCNSNTDKNITSTGTDSSNNSAVLTNSDTLIRDPNFPQRPPDGEADRLEGCYMQVLSRDTFVAVIHEHNNKITGKLSFNNYEKDGSSGRINGSLENDIVKGLYTFNAEGMRSVMEVYFKHSPGKLLRGTGPMKSRGDTMVFISPTNLVYDGGTWQQLPCDQLGKKYQ